MAKYLFVFGVLASLVGWVRADPISISGSLSTNTSGEIVSNGDWLTPSGFKVAWNITGDTTTPINYSYTFSAADGGNVVKGLSHIILRVSDTFTLADIWNASPSVFYLRADVTTPDRWSGDDPSNPNMPGAISGIKWNVSGGSATISFTSARLPIEGNFYAKDGKTEGIGDITAWNSAFDRSGTATIWVPDSHYTIIPLPTAAWSTLLLLGALGLRRPVRP